MVREFFEGIKRGQKKFGEDISAIVNLLLLSFVYFVGVGFTFLFAKIFSKHFLDLKFANKNSYWRELGLGKRKMEEHYRQF